MNTNNYRPSPMLNVDKLGYYEEYKNPEWKDLTEQLDSV